MKKTVLTSVIVLLVSVGGFGAVSADEWRFPVGIAYVSGVRDLVNQYEDNLRADGWITESTDGLPVGLSVQPYYELSSGLGFGVGFGPTMVIYGDRDFFNVPINACVRYSLMPRSNNSVYFKAGVSHNLADGDYVEDANPGFIGAIGIEFKRKNKIGFGFEIGYDSSTIEIEDRTTAAPDDTEEYEPTGFMAMVFAVF